MRGDARTAGRTEESSLAFPIDRLIGDTADEVAQIGLGIEPVHLRGLCRPANYAEWFWKQPPFALTCGLSSDLPQFHSA